MIFRAYFQDPPKIFEINVPRKRLLYNDTFFPKLKPRREISSFETRKGHHSSKRRRISSLHPTDRSVVRPTNVWVGRDQLWTKKMLEMCVNSWKKTQSLHSKGPNGQCCILSWCYEVFVGVDLSCAARISWKRMLTLVAL